MSTEQKTSSLVQFYDLCQRKGYTDMKDESQSLKAKVIAKDLGLDYRKIEELYEKAKACSEAEKEKREQRKKREAERKAREAVPGVLILELSSSVKDDEKSERRIKIFRRPDGSIYSILDKSMRYEKAPTFELHKSTATTFTYTPDQTLFTSATVGGVTTGGFDTIKGGISVSGGRNSGKGYMTVSLGSSSFTVQRVILSPKTMEVFKRDKALQFCSGTIRLFQNSSKGDLYSYAALGAKNAASAMSAISLAADETRVSYDECLNTLELIQRVISWRHPPTDEEYFQLACKKSESEELAKLEEAVGILGLIRDSHVLTVPENRERGEKIWEKWERLLQESKEAAILREETNRKKIRKFLRVAIPAAAVIIVAVTLYFTLILPGIKYRDAVALSETERYEAATIFYRVKNYKDARERSFALWDDLAVRNTVDAGSGHTVGLKVNGTVVAVGSNKYGQCEVSGWTDIVAIAAGHFHTVGLKADGTVVATGANESGMCDVSGWKGIVAIAAGSAHTVGLKADGTVVAKGYNKSGQCNVSDWTDIVAIAAGNYYTVGLKADGTVVAVGMNNDGQCDVGDWKDIVAIAAGDGHTVGLKADGTVVAVGDNDSGQCNVSSWADIVAIAADDHYTVGLKAARTVVPAGSNSYSHGVSSWSGWRDIVAIAAGDGHTVGLKADGTVVTVGDNDSGQCDVSDWTNIKLPD